MSKITCRFCNHEITTTFVDLGMSPLANSYIAKENKNEKEIFFPLHAYICEKCFLVQLPVFEKPENIFSEYHYLSSYSTTWLNHAKDYVEKMLLIKKLNQDSLVIEIASNDGYLLQFFKQRNIPVLGIEPAKNIAKLAIEKSIPTLSAFFGDAFAKELVKDERRADLVVANNVLAHVPDINSFVKGIKVILKDDGFCTVEFPSLSNLIQLNQFDTIYHEHFSYLSLTFVNSLFRHQGLKVFNVEELSTHGGSLRVYITHIENESVCISAELGRLLKSEEDKGFNDINMYQEFKERVYQTKRDILKLLIELKNLGKQIVAYGAPAKGNTLLNYCGIRQDFIDYTVDRNPHKQGCYLPGTHIPIYAVDKIWETKPDAILILPWNLKDEIIEQMSAAREWGAKFIVPIPHIEVIE